MKKLRELLVIEESEVKQMLLKKAFMPYSECVDIDGFEKEAMTILLNLSSHHKSCKCTDWLDSKRAKSYLKDKVNVEASILEIKWFHTHNLKFPDCRVKEQRIIGKPLPTSERFISSFTLEPCLGWAHNAAVYRHTIWLLNQVKWQSESVNILSLISAREAFFGEICFRSLAYVITHLTNLRKQ